MKNINFSKIGLLIILGIGWVEKIFDWPGVHESIYNLASQNIVTSWMTSFGDSFPALFIGIFELIVFLLLLFREKVGAILSCIVFAVTLSFLSNGFSFSLAKDVVMLGVSLDLMFKHMKRIL
jgi:hypothetical protein